MNTSYIIGQLETNIASFDALFDSFPAEYRAWKPSADKWCLLEILCHLYDEERDDFRFRLKHVLEHPQDPLPPIDPPAWVIEHKYMEQDFNPVLQRWNEERIASVNWLRSLENPPLEQFYEHPKLGPLSGNVFLANWLAHDYLHIRQITKLKFDLLADLSKQDLSYAGDW